MVKILQRFSERPFLVLFDGLIGEQECSFLVFAKNRTDACEMVVKGLFSGELSDEEDFEEVDEDNESFEVRMSTQMIVVDVMDCLGDPYFRENLMHIEGTAGVMQDSGYHEQAKMIGEED
jgi:hypothetical protein